MDMITIMIMKVIGKAYNYLMEGKLVRVVKVHLKG